MDGALCQALKAGSLLETLSFCPTLFGSQINKRYQKKKKKKGLHRAPKRQCTPSGGPQGLGFLLGTKHPGRGAAQMRGVEKPLPEAGTVSGACEGLKQAVLHLCGQHREAG